MCNEIPVVKIKAKSGVVYNYAVIGGNYYYFGDDSYRADKDNWLRMYTRVYLIKGNGYSSVMSECVRRTPELVMAVHGVKRIPKPFIYRYVP